MQYNHTHQSVTAIQFGFEWLLEIVELTISEESQREHFKKQAEETMIALVCSVLMREHGIRGNEIAFIDLLFSWNKSEQSSERLLVEYAEKWKWLSLQIPDFYKHIVSFDEANQSNHASTARCHIQLAGNNAAISDHGFGVAERGMVRDYIRRLEAYVEARLQ